MRIIELDDGAELTLGLAPGGAGLAGSLRLPPGCDPTVPGPMLAVDQGSEVTVRVTGNGGCGPRVHWHGLPRPRAVGLQRRDGEPGPEGEGAGEPQRLRFPSPGLYWYHSGFPGPWAAEPGFYGGVLVRPRSPNYWGRAEREHCLLIGETPLPAAAAASPSRPPTEPATRGRASPLRVNGMAGWSARAQAGEVVRLYLANAAAPRILHLRLPGAVMKLVGSDGGRVERESLVDRVLLAPFERAIVEALFPRPGRYRLDHRLPGRSLAVASFEVGGTAAAAADRAGFEELRVDPALGARRRLLPADLEREPQLVIATLEALPEGFEAEPVASGERVKIRFVNRTSSPRPRHHLIHLGGERFLVLSRDGVPCRSLAWKDTILLRAGEVVDVVVEAGAPGPMVFHLVDADQPGDHLTLALRVQA